MQLYQTTSKRFARRPSPARFRSQSDPLQRSASGPPIPQKHPLDKSNPMALLTTNDITSCLRRHFKGAFLGVVPLNRLPRHVIRDFPFGFVVNTDLHGLPGRHWLAVYGTRRRVEIFDPLSTPLPSILVRWILKRFTQRWETNSRPYQGPTTTLCGAYCIWYLLTRSRRVSMQATLYPLSPVKLSANDAYVLHFYNTTCLD